MTEQPGLFQFVRPKSWNEDCMKQAVSNDVMTKHKTYKRIDSTTFDDSDIDWTEFDKMTDEEAHRKALADPDARPWTEEGLKGFKRVNPKKKEGGTNE